MEKENVRSDASSSEGVNISWMLLGRLVIMGGGFLVSSATARHLGPEGFGLLSYAISLYALLSITGHLGLGNLAIRELVRDPSGANEILGTIAAVKLVGLTIGALILSVFAVANLGDPTGVACVLIPFAVALVLKISDIVDLWFQSIVQQRAVVKCSIAAFLVASVFSVIGILINASVVWFSFNILISNFILLPLLFFIYAKNGSSPKLNKWAFSRSRLRLLAGPSALGALGTFFSLLSLKVDQIMLNAMIGPAEVGLYAVAAQLSEVWVFIPTILVIAFFPKLISLRERDHGLYKDEMQNILSALCVMSYILIAFVFLFGDEVIRLFFGAGFQESGDILKVHVIGSIFVFIRLVFSRWIVIENLLVFSVVTQFFGAAVNVILNYIFIPKYGAMGAAIITVVSYSIAGYWSLLLSAQTRLIFWQMTKAFVSPKRGMGVLRRLVDDLFLKNRGTVS